MSKILTLSCTRLIEHPIQTADGSTIVSVYTFVYRGATFYRGNWVPWMLLYDIKLYSAISSEIFRRSGSYF